MAIMLASIVLIGIACGPSATEESRAGDTVAPTAKPTVSGTVAPTHTPTSAPSAVNTIAPVPTEVVPTATVVQQSLKEVAKVTNPGVPIVQRGDLGAQAKEKTTLQLAIDSMMVANLKAKVTPNSTADYIRAEGVAETDTDFGGGLTLVGHTRMPITTYCYTWDANGSLLTQLEPGDPPCGATP